MRTFYLLIAVLFSNPSFSQDIKKKIDDAMNKLAVDEQFKHSILSMYVVDGKTGKVLYGKNSEVGLAPASCQKIVTSASAFEMLGKDFTYQTSFGYENVIANDSSKINLYVVGSGDPTFGSSRWKQTHEDFIIRKIISEVEKLKVNTIESFIIDESKWGTQTIPAGWPWEDVGQYYGAGSNSFNWAENQYGIILKPGKRIGDAVSFIRQEVVATGKVINELTTGPKGSGDRVNVYSSMYSKDVFLRGTAPLAVDSLIVYASAADGKYLFQNNVLPLLNQKRQQEIPILSQPVKYQAKTIYNFISPTLDSINYWFLKKSINLYGEAFVKTIAYQKTKMGSTDSGVKMIRNFWADKGIEISSLKIIDGSGLSPANRLTTNSLVTVLQYAKNRPWFSSFYNALPEINGIKMKDGYIGGVRSYAGYIKSASGTEYSFAFIVNNFDGSPATVREKMWRVLDLLK